MAAEECRVAEAVEVAVQAVASATGGNEEVVEDNEPSVASQLGTAAVEEELSGQSGAVAQLERSR